MGEPIFRAPKGTQDILPPESARWVELIAAFAQRAERAGYGLVVSPMFEHYDVFARVGASTDIVRKEMYDFEDRGGRHLALRPEGTASIVRAYVEHRPTPPFKAWYAAPNFRNEAPQAGRYRQHHQLGVEAIGSDDPHVDVEVIAMLAGFYADLGLRRVTLDLTSLGDPACRPSYLSALRDFLVGESASLSEQSRQTLEANPLRVLDSKRAEDAAVIDAAPKLLDHLCDACAEHLRAVRSGLDALGIEHQLAPRLVRGLDYSTRTTFEFPAAALDSAQNAVGGGGRYDGLAEDMGGPATPGIGFGAGIERILMACDAEGVFGVPSTLLDVFVVDVVDGTHALLLTHELRAAGLRADRAFDGRSMKAQMKKANSSGAPVAVIVGEQEVADGTVAIRDLAVGEQEVVPRADVVERVRKRMKVHQ
jgi:histidyl-tRNA synthetase